MIIVFGCKEFWLWCVVVLCECNKFDDVERMVWDVFECFLEDCDFLEDVFDLSIGLEY